MPPRLHLVGGAAGVQGKDQVLLIDSNHVKSPLAKCGRAVPAGGGGRRYCKRFSHSMQGQM
jgi:hypothetical protein